MKRNQTRFGPHLHGTKKQPPPSRLLSPDRTLPGLSARPSAGAHPGQRPAPARPPAPPPARPGPEQRKLPGRRRGLRGQSGSGAGGAPRRPRGAGGTDAGRRSPAGEARAWPRRSRAGGQVSPSAGQGPVRVGVGVRVPQGRVGGGRSAGRGGSRPGLARPRAWARARGPGCEAEGNARGRPRRRRPCPPPSGAARRTHPRPAREPREAQAGSEGGGPRAAAARPEVRRGWSARPL